MTLVPIRNTSSENSAYSANVAIRWITPPITPIRKKLPMSDATPASTMTMIACVKAFGSTSISSKVFTSACIAPIMRPVRSAIRQPPLARQFNPARGLLFESAGGNRKMARKSKKDRVGDVLGLGNVGGSSVRNGDPAMHHESDEARRRQRMSEGADELTPTATAPDRHSGATGIDMGDGGEGTDLD